jgi:hypothetical protein
MDALRLDEHLWLSGDEDCGVGINCRICDRGGAPVAYYEGISTGVYAGADVETVSTISALISAGERHLAQHD